MSKDRRTKDKNKNGILPYTDTEVERIITAWSKPEDENI